MRTCALHDVCIPCKELPASHNWAEASQAIHVCTDINSIPCKTTWQDDSYRSRRRRSRRRGKEERGTAWQSCQTFSTFWYVFVFFVCLLKRITLTQSSRAEREGKRQRQSTKSDWRQRERGREWGRQTDRIFGFLHMPIWGAQTTPRPVRKPNQSRIFHVCVPRFCRIFLFPLLPLLLFFYVIVVAVALCFVRQSNHPRTAVVSLTVCVCVRVWLLFVFVQQPSNICSCVLYKNHVQMWPGVCVSLRVCSCVWATNLRKPKENGWSALLGARGLPRAGKALLWVAISTLVSGLKAF